MAEQHNCLTAKAYLTIFNRTKRTTQIEPIDKSNIYIYRAQWREIEPKTSSRCVVQRCFFLPPILLSFPPPISPLLIPPNVLCLVPCKWDIIRLNLLVNFDSPLWTKRFTMSFFVVSPTVLQSLISFLQCILFDVNSVRELLLLSVLWFFGFTSVVAKLLCIRS